MSRFIDQNHPQRPWISGIHRKFLIFYLGLGLAGMVFMMMLVMRDAGFALEQQIQRRMSVSANAVSELITADLSEKFSTFRNLSENPIFTDALRWKGRKDRLKKFLKHLSLPGKGRRPPLLMLLDSRGKVVASNFETRETFGSLSWWYIIQHKNSYIEPVMNNGKSGILIALPVSDGHGAQGALVGKLNLSFVDEIAALNPEFQAALLGNSGITYYGNLPFELVAKVAVADLKPRAPTVFESDGRIYEAFSIQGVPGLDWNVVLSVPKEAVTLPVFELVRRMAVVSLATVLLLALLVFWRARTLTDPIDKLQRTMRAIIESGDLEKRVIVQQRQGDEVVALAETFNRMLDSLSSRNQLLLQSHEELEIQRAKSAESAKMAALGEMAGGLAHEINTPLAVISMCAGQLKDGLHRERGDPKILARLAERIEGTTTRIAKIVKGMRCFSRDAGNDPPAPVPVQSLIEDTLVLCQERFRLHGITLKVSGAQVESEVNCRSVQIVQTLLNMLNNSFDAVECLDEKWIHMDVREEGDFIEMAITDSGKGIPPAVQEKMFHPFFTTKEIGRGTGLGLSISKGIIENHGGSLWLDRESPNTRFVLRLCKAGKGLAASRPLRMAEPAQRGVKVSEDISRSSGS